MRLNEIPERTGINQSEIAQRAGMTRQTVSQYLNGVRGKDFHPIAKIKEVTGVCAETVYFKNDNGENDQMPEYWLNVATEALRSAKQTMSADDAEKINAVIDTLIKTTT
jgi:transcriptional regulator with XRE-family HTH domain